MEGKVQTSQMSCDCKEEFRHLEIWGETSSFLKIRLSPVSENTQLQRAENGGAKDWEPDMDDAV